ncbi:conjugal transfer protein TraK [Leeuwenhoekiella sp. UBA6783]|mgnify:CR=1 FL=1|uniref:conjugal transfer protein TraK n=1 Tax=Leeuwenhoekiella sp. UBA6783 TaxID=1946747 RepID=UPI0025BFADCF|nr:conjugal transfer protein TraK [Leeuwenhoekiella sp. UBA6783]|tara:strand:+ start:2659 stop:3273 length:615 start_codon:yes stop_codon:yes gene_type:complete
MKTPYSNIYAVLKTNRFIVYSCVVSTTLCVLFSGWMVYSSYQKFASSAFAISTTGEVIPLRLTTEREHLEVEALAHLDLFHRYFYNIDASNYTVNLDKALWLGNSSVDQVYQQKRADGLYNRLIQYSLVQRVLQIESQIELDANPIQFKTTLTFEINRGSVTDTYQLQTTGNLISVARNFPNNPHGLLITNYFEQHLQKIDSQE